MKVQSTRFNLSHLVSENMKSAGVLHSVLGSVLGGKMPFSWCELLQHLMKLPLPGGRNKLMTKLLKLIKYQKNSRAFFLLSSRIKSGFWCMMDSTGHIYGSFRHNDLSSLINNSSVSQFSPDPPQKHILCSDSLGREARPNPHMSSYKIMEEYMKNTDD